MNIAVTGGGGFVGSHLIPALLLEGHSVRVFSRNKVSPVIGVAKFEGKMSSESDLEKFLLGSELLINLIGCFEAPFEDQMESNAIIPFHLFSSAGKFGIKKIIHVSAAAVYGNAAIVKAPKEIDVTEPSTPYGLSKILGEEIVRFCAHQNNLSYIILRPTNIYASDARAGVLQSMKQSWIKNGVLTVTGDGKQVRDFIHVEDLVSAIHLMIVKSNKSNIYNVASNEVLEINDVVDIFKRLSTKKVGVDHRAAPNGYVRSLRADNSRLMNEYGWKPMHNVTNTVAELLK